MMTMPIGCVFAPRETGHKQQNETGAFVIVKYLISARAKMEKSDELLAEQDSDPYLGDLDNQCTWKNFCGLTLDEAQLRSREHSERYREEFMAMCGKAFAYSYPVLASYVGGTELVPSECRDDREEWILPQGLKHHFSGWHEPHVRHLRREVLRLCEFVRGNLVFYPDSQDEQEEIDEQWEALKVHPAKKDS